MTDVPVTLTPQERATSEQADRKRARLRLRLLLFSLPVVIIVLLIAAKLLSLSSIAQIAITQYDRGNFVGSAETSEGQLETNWLEPWIPFFNRGVATAADEEYIPAIEDFEKALALAPDDRRCEVALNLSLGWEKLADGYAAAGYFTGAALLYETAVDVLADAGEGCTEEQLEEALGRLQQKYEAIQDLIELTQPEAGEPTTPEEREQQLQEQQDDAAQDKSNDDARDRSEDGPPGFSVKPW